MTKPLTRLLQGAGFSVGALGVGIAFGLVLTPYMLATLGDAAYGVYALASLFAGWCGLLDFGLTTTTSRYVTRFYTQGDLRGVNEIGATAITLFGGISALVFLLACSAFLVARFFGAHFDETGLLAGALFFAGAAFAVSKISDGLCGVIKGSLRQELTGGTVFIFRILFGLVNFAVLYCGGRVIALFVGNLALTVVQLLVYAVLVRRAAPFFRFSFRNFRKARVRTLFNYSFFAFLSQAGELAVNRSDLIVIAALMSAPDVARYNLVVVTLMSYFNSFLYEASNWETNWFAKLTARETAEEGPREKSAAPPAAFGPEFYRSRAAITRASIYLAAFMAFGLLAFGRPFIARWIGPEYLDAFPALALCAAAAGLYRGSAETNARMLQGVARHRILAWAAIAHGVLNVLLSVLFVKLGLGLTGVALGTVLPGVAIHYFWTPNAACRLVGEKRRVYWSRQIRTTLVAAAALALPALCAWKFAAPSYPVLAALAAAFAAFYAAFVYRAGLDANERAWIRKTLREKFNRIKSE